MTVRTLRVKGISLAASIAAGLALGLGGSPSLAGDPFRTRNPHDIGDKTEEAFLAIFRQGNYKAAEVLAEEATQVEPDEPLGHAIRAALAYTEEDWSELKTYGNKTLEAANTLKGRDPIRGNLYLAVGHFLKGTYLFKTEGPLGAINQLPLVFQYLEAAEKLAPEDPEVNLLKGYLDLILAANLPFSKPEQAIDRFAKYAEPDYLVNRALGTAYRDLKQYDKALQYMEKALGASPENPELQYLKGQILRNQGRKDNDVALLKQALSYFERAMAKEDQLSKIAQIPLRHDYQAVQEDIKKLEPTAQRSQPSLP